MALLTCEEFRQKRDQFALDGFRLRWPILNEKRKATLAQIIVQNQLMTTWVLTESAKKHCADEKRLLQTMLGKISSEMAMIEAEAPIRKMNLGLMPIPKEPSPELKMRLTLFIIELGRDLLMKGIPE